jgi:hypothetical protein
MADIAGKLISLVKKGRTDIQSRTDLDCIRCANIMNSSFQTSLPFPLNSRMLRVGRADSYKRFQQKNKASLRRRLRYPEPLGSESILIDLLNPILYIEIDRITPLLTVKIALHLQLWRDRWATSIKTASLPAFTT